MLKRLTVLSLLALAACQGEEGPAGPPGPQGPAGPTGPAGMTAVSTIFCTGQGNNGGTGTFDLTHILYLFSDESVLATCSIVTPSLAVDGVYLFRKTQPGAVQATCPVFADTDGTATGGFWQFDLNTQRTASTAIFHDSGSAQDGRSFPLTCSTR